MLLYCHPAQSRRRPPRQPRQQQLSAAEEGSRPRQDVARVEARRDDLAGRVEADAPHDAHVLIPGKAE